MEAFAKCAPVRTLRIVTTVDDAQMEPGHFARRPKVMYRLGEKYGRIEEELNPASGLHLLIVINEPDMWMVNLADKTGQHAVDEGPTFIFRAPIIGDLSSEYWNKFEFGCEVPFMQAVKASKREDARSGTTTYEHQAEGVTVALVTSKTGIPQRVTITNADGTYAFVYQSFEQLDNADTRLFDRPAGIKFTEAVP